MHSMSKAPLVIGCMDRDDLDLDHPAFNNPANCKYNGFSWSPEKGTLIDEPAQRMAMITEYAMFEPSKAMHRVWDAAANATFDPDRHWSENGIDYYGYVHGTEAARDLKLACMGL